MQANQRRLGHSGLEVAPLAFGGNVFGWTADEPTSFRLLDAFVAAGFNLIDTADVYSRWAPGNQGGESETIIGKWLQASGKRDKVVIATKVGMEMGPGDKGLSRAYILRAVERVAAAAADRPHRPLPVAHGRPRDAAGGDARRVRRADRSRARCGRSAPRTTRADRLAEALRVSRDHGLPRYECLQPHYNLFERADFEERAGAALPARGPRRHPLLLAGQRVPDRQVPLRGRPGQEPRGARGSRSTSTSAASASSRRSTRWRRRYALDAGPGGARPGCWPARASPRRSPARRTSSSSTT